MILLGRMRLGSFKMQLLRPDLSFGEFEGEAGQVNAKAGGGKTQVRNSTLDDPPNWVVALMVPMTDRFFISDLTLRANVRLETWRIIFWYLNFK